MAASALAYVRSESGMCHAAAALSCPQVTLFGGCMDAEVMGGYELQECIVDDSHDTPCGSWHRCQHCLDAMDRITVKRVRSALQRILRRTH
jgi:ADP-heptose:LPS heptosyltransferase